MTAHEVTAGSTGKSRWGILLLWLLALLLAGWTLSGLPLNNISQTIAALAWTQWLLWLTLNVLIIAFATRRWQVLSSMFAAPIGFVPLLLVRQAGQAVSFITPGPQFGGEPLQIYLLCRRYAQPLHKAVAALGLDRLYELLINFSVLLLGVLYLLSQGSAVAQWRSIAGVLLMMVLLIAVLGWLLVRRPHWLTNWLNSWVTGRLQGLMKRWEQYPRLRQIGSHWQVPDATPEQTIPTHKGPLFLAVLLSLLGWATLLAELSLLLKFVDIQFTLPGFVLIAVALRLAMLLPLPGGIGTVEASVLWSIHTLGLPVSAAIGLIALMRLRDAIMLFAGLLSLRLLQRRSLLIEEGSL